MEYPRQIILSSPAGNIILSRQVIGGVGYIHFTAGPREVAQITNTYSAERIVRITLEKIRTIFEECLDELLETGRIEPKQFGQFHIFVSEDESLIRIPPSPGQHAHFMNEDYPKRVQIMEKALTEWLAKIDKFETDALKWLEAYENVESSTGSRARGR